MGKIGVLAMTTKRNKYNAKKVECDGHVFDSKKEYERYLVLKDMERRGEISQLTLQPRMQLFPAFRTSEGKYYRETVYVADFSYIQNGMRIYEDVKSPATRTQLYMLKKKLAAMNGYEVVEVM